MHSGSLLPERAPYDLVFPRSVAPSLLVTDLERTYLFFFKWDTVSTPFKEPKPTQNEINSPNMLLC